MVVAGWHTWTCILCDFIKVLANATQIRNRLSGDAEQCKNNGGTGPCPSAPAVVKQKFYQLAATLQGARKGGYRHGCPRSRALRSRRAPAAAARATGAANGGENNPRTHAPLQGRA